jgi:outer membrane lipoprotein-sorting protein
MAVAVAGSALGVAGLAVAAIPAGAGETPPELPPITAEELVQSTLEAQPGAFEGTVEVTNDLGLPALPGVGGMDALDAEAIRINTDGQGRSRVAVQQPSAERTVVFDGSTVWTYDSTTNSATRLTLPAGTGVSHGTTPDGEVTDPATAATALLDVVRDSSTLTVDGTARVADRPAYELVLTPKPTERTVLREVRVAVDSETRMPLRLSVMTNGTTEPALEIGFSDLELGPQPADLFRFTPPAGATVTEEQAPSKSETSAAIEQVEGNIDVVGEGWDTVLVGSVAPEALQGGPNSGQDGGPDVRALLGQIGKPVSGEFGSGHVVSTKVGNALLADDGRFAVGAVPEQVLVEALGTR